MNGFQLIAGQWVDIAGDAFQVVNPATGEQLDGNFQKAGAAEVDQAAQAAWQAFDRYRQLGNAQRAEFLEAIATELEGRREAIVSRAMLETALPQARLDGELGRTTGQLRLFGNLLRDGNWVRAVIDQAAPDRQPLAKPDTRLSMVPLGPVAVFGASNFPLAFSVAGGDTASALAAGCPVIVKGHPAHPGTSALVGEAIAAAIAACGLPGGIFSLLQGDEYQLGSSLVQHPLVKAVGFTGSISGGRALFDLAVSRSEPIPFYGELGSSNPVFLLPEALEQRGDAIAQGLVGSLVMGAGQFCTNPGLVVACDTPALHAFIEKAKRELQHQPAQTMLTAGICEAYNNNSASRGASSAITELASGDAAEEGSCQAQARLWSVSGEDYLATPDLEEEIFGPSTLLVTCKDSEQMIQIADQLSGHLTSTIHSESGDHVMAARLLHALQLRVGRVLFDGYPTGVEVAHSMNHGGPYPASTDSRGTSVGSRAIDRFVRPFCYQNTPDALLPPELQNANPLNIFRLVDGDLTSQAV